LGEDAFLGLDPIYGVVKLGDSGNQIFGEGHKIFPNIIIQWPVEVKEFFIIEICKSCEEFYCFRMKHR